MSTEFDGIDSAAAAVRAERRRPACRAFANVARLAPGERVLIHGALGGFASAFPGIARQLGASRVVDGPADKLDAAAVTRLPYDQIVDSSKLPDALAGEKFDGVSGLAGPTFRRTRRRSALAAEAALKAVAAGLAETEIEVLPFDEAVTAHQRMESRALNGRIVLTP